ncbi:FtsX-like permease family protein [Paraclostridium ghonii]|uniref:ABC-type lipoprotein release transport system permease subunit n=1 Tax=Paraclostridium ghonii TaxID=29358 RepID=A0ABU0MY12_9FIRM|nr:FtsX-like permease family protein [Paeniclostridium ghonii]MDQ0555624.1 ABC-type lipoprotein release transport system permease subunit [Paeniclostridium ghonii]
MFEFKLALKYLKKNKKESISIIACIVVAITLILGVDIIGDSMSINQINQAKEIAGYYDGTFISNNQQNIEKLKKVDEVYNLSTVKNLGEFILQDGLKSKLYSFDKNYLKDLNYDLISGRYPKNEHEIIIDSKLLGKYDKENILNKSISGVNKINYKLDETNEIYSKKDNYKVVGVISKVEDYYNLEDIELDSFVGDSEDIIPNKFITYSTIYNVKGINEHNIDQKFNEIRKKYDPSSDYTTDIRKDGQSGVSSNQYLDAALRLYGDFQQENQKEVKILVAITASLTIFNYFNIILSKMMNQIGDLRTVGMSNKKVIRFYLFQMSILFSIGGFIGFISSIIFARYAMSIFIGFNLFNISDFRKVKLNVSYLIVSKALLITLCALLIAICLPIAKSLKKYPMDLINKSDKVNYKTKKNKKILETLLKNNLLRSKSKTIISIVIIAFSGFVFISCTSTNIKDYINQIRKYSLGRKEEYSYMIKPYENIDENINKISMKDISSIKKIKGIRDFNLLSYTIGYLTISKDNLNESYIKMDGIKDNKKENLESMALISGVDDYNKLNKYVKEGSLEKNNEQNNKFIDVAICNKFGNLYNKGKMEDAIKDLNIGDTFEFKVLNKKDNKEFGYKTYKCRVNAILDESFKYNNGMGNYATAMGIYMDLESFKNITNDTYTQEVNFNIEGKSNKQADKLVDNINKKYNSLNIITPTNKYKSSTDSNSYLKSRLMLGSILLIASLFNIYTTVSININNNIREFSILRAIGLKKKYLKELVIYEALVYSLIGSVLAGVAVSIDEIIFLTNSKQGYSELGINLKIRDIYIPPKEILIFMSVAILFAFLIGSFKSKLIDKIDINEGINKY